MGFVKSEINYYVKISLNKFPENEDDLMAILSGDRVFRNHSTGLSEVFEEMSGISKYAIKNTEFDESSKDSAVYLEFNNHHFNKKQIPMYGKYIESFIGLAVFGDMSSFITKVEFYCSKTAMKKIPH